MSRMKQLVELEQCAIESGDDETLSVIRSWENDPDCEPLQRAIVALLDCPCPPSLPDTGA